MKKIPQRIPEGEAILDSSEMTIKEYSETMKRMLGKQYDLFADNVIKKAIPWPNSIVLEIGPGPGWGGISLLHKRPDFYLDGIEASQDMIAVAQENAKTEKLEDRIEYFEGFGEKMRTVPDNTYDLVISRESLHHWVDPEAVFKEIDRVLKPDGKICIYDHRRDLNLFGRMIVSIFGTVKAGPMAKHWKNSIAAGYTEGELREKLDGIGFSDWTVEADFMDIAIYKR